MLSITEQAAAPDLLVTGRAWNLAVDWDAVNKGYPSAVIRDASSIPASFLRLAAQELGADFDIRPRAVTSI